MSRTPRHLVLAATALLAGGVVGSAGTVRAQSQATTALPIAVDASPAGLDPHVVTAFASAQIVNGTIYEGLTAVGPDLAVGPSLAQSWTISSDGLSYRFTLRPGVVFHDGSGLTAEDAAASLRRVMAKETGSPLASRLASVESVGAPDPQTLVVSLKAPSAPLLAGLAGIAVVPKAFETDRDALQRTPVGTGPFRFSEWRPNGHVLLARNERYWQTGLPKLGGLRFDIVPEAATRQVGLSNGQYAMLPGLDAATALQIKGKSGLALAQTLDLAYTLVGMNAGKPPFDDARVREALNTALNREEIVEAALFGAGVPGGPLSPALKAWALPVQDFPCYRPDPARAQTLLKEAGLTLPVSVTMNVLPRQDVKDIAQVMQEQLGKAGFKVELKVQELGQFIQDWRNGNFTLFASVNGGGPDPDEYFFRTFRTGGSTNVFKYANPELDRLLDEGRATSDVAARKAAYDAAQRILACSGPAAHIAYGTLFTASRAGLQGYAISPLRLLTSLREATYAGR